MNARLVISCEHGGYALPTRLSRSFAGRTRWLKSHRGWDPGALALAQDLSRMTSAPMVASTITRLVVDLNRSESSDSLWSSVSRNFGAALQEDILTTYYRLYRRDVLNFILRAARSGRAIHLSMHSFTPVFHGHRRDVDIGVLFDPARTGERTLARSFIRTLEHASPRWRIRPNQPYRGTDDGLTTHFRTLLPDHRYAGLEIEINQRFVRATSWPRTRGILAAALAGALREHA